jgi:hypothetical protein
LSKKKNKRRKTHEDDSVIVEDLLLEQKADVKWHQLKKKGSMKKGGKKQCNLSDNRKGKR